ncbi:hypothetical protein CYLTODRAFT_381509 [Cylindrobasidium torrendii FP15055 ss-10]|uniref:Nudix hydrolase domain-containing protein n=1 Tax=Cylindrobasidium torrendii FP15055 ss-10 TaxID=1314674 RepID=A0A0D7B191_9AGAR|nr:hypothetical protein CYLTODRAFT_381509 [Cylindrobasidium torrendii FP15055 ss-10]
MSSNFSDIKSHLSIAFLGGAASVLLARQLYTLVNASRAVAHPRYPKQTQHTSEEFVLAAGAVAFLISPTSPLKVVLVHFTKNRDEWLLAKGRKDVDESLSAAALRETYEETGYKCSLVDIPELKTRATQPGLATTAHQADVPHIAYGAKESVCVTLRPLQTANHVKMIFWYVAEVVEDNSDLTGRVGTHMISEGFESSGLFEIEEAMGLLTFKSDRDVLATAVKYASQRREQLLQKKAT